MLCAHVGTLCCVHKSTSKLGVPVYTLPKPLSFAVSRSRRKYIVYCRPRVAAHPFPFTSLFRTAIGSSAFTSVSRRIDHFSLIHHFIAVAVVVRDTGGKASNRNINNKAIISIQSVIVCRRPRKRKAVRFLLQTIILKPARNLICLHRLSAAYTCMHIKRINN